MSLGRTFGFAKDGRIKVDVRAELFNVFNRLFLAIPTGNASGVTNNGANNGPNAAAPTTRNAQGRLTGGYGFVNTFNGFGSQPRTGQIVARFSF